jgi:hypothetical protein
VDQEKPVIAATLDDLMQIPVEHAGFSIYTPVQGPA